MIQNTDIVIHPHLSLARRAWVYYGMIVLCDLMRLESPVSVNRFQSGGQVDIRPGLGAVPVTVGYGPDVVLLRGQ
jgi:hypothetical protein